MARVRLEDPNSRLPSPLTLVMVWFPSRENVPTAPVVMVEAAPSALSVAETEPALTVNWTSDPVPSSARIPAPSFVSPLELAIMPPSVRV